MAQGQIYYPYKAEKLIKIRALFSLHYFTFKTGFAFEGENHDFWEMVYVDKGEVDIGADDKIVRLSQGEVIFHKPGEFHSIWANCTDSPNIMVISFDCRSPAMRHFHSLHCALETPLRRMLSQVLTEAMACFGPTLDGADRLIVQPSAPKESNQLIFNYLELFLTLLLRQRTVVVRPGEPMTSEHQTNELIERLAKYMRGHLDGSLRFSDICRESGVSAATLKECFRRQMRIGPMAYYQRLRLEEARRLLRSGAYNVTETAAALGYPCVHAFSRQFKDKLGLSPKAYIKSVRL
ncbi:MAG TPA: AraC family transcriptional regulator [Clostridia bacterium]|nr:AraC family transcriptional regulator [Clostridia bacterium]